MERAGFLPGYPLAGHLGTWREPTGPAIRNQCRISYAARHGDGRSKLQFLGNQALVT